MPTRWKAVDGFAVHIYQAGDLSVLYHEGSGDTHMLDASGMALFDYLTRDAASWDEMIAFLESDPHGTIGPEGLQTLLDSLVRAGIVVRMTT